MKIQLPYNQTNKRIAIILAWVLIGSLFPQIVKAQMFSQDDDEERSRAIPALAIYAGPEPIKFEYQGNDQTTPAAGTYSFDGTIVHFSVEGRGVKFHLGTGGDFSGLDNISYFDTGIKAGYGFSLYRAQNVGVQFPLQLHSGYTSVANDEILAPSAPEFQLGTFGVGAGVEFFARLSSKTRINANILPSYAFSFSFRERDADGSMVGFEGGARLFFDQLFGSAGLSFGYDYNFRQYDINGAVLDYDAMAHSFLIGVTF